MMNLLKKIGGLALCMFLCMTLITAMPVVEAAGDIVMDLDFKNPGFEEIDENGHPKDVTAYKGWDGGFVTHSTEQAHSGKYSAKISTNQSGYPWVRFDMDAPPDTDFEISAWIYVDGKLGGSGFGIKTEWWNADGVQVRGADAIRINTMESGKWVHITATCHSEPDVTAVWIYFRLYGTGTFYVDDVAGKITSTPPIGGVLPDEFFFYPEWTEGEAQVSANVLTYPKLASGTAELALKDGDTVLESTKLQLKNGLADWTYSTEKMTKEAFPYALEATLYDEEGKNMGKVSRNVYRFNRPTCLTAEGDYINDDGSIFIPKIAYHVDTGWGFGGEKGGIKKQLEYAKSVGINTVQVGTALAWYPENYLPMMDLLAEMDMKGLVCLYASRERAMAAAGAKENVEITRTIVELVKDHPATFAYAIFDEPSVGRYGLTEDDLINSYTLIRSIDKKHPTYVVVAPTKSGAEDVSLAYMTKYTDVVCYDPYPGTWDDPVASYVHEVHSAAVEDIYRGKPTYTLLQTFDFGEYFPTAEEYRHMWYQAAIGGSKGIGYYSHQDAFIGEKGEKIGLWTTDIWDDMVTFAKEEMLEAEKHFWLGEYPTVNKGATDKYIYESWTDGKDIYMVVLDKSPSRAKDRTETEAVTVSIPITSANGRISVGAFTAKELYGAKGRSFSGEKELTIPLGWRDCVVYKITPAEAIDYSLLNASSFTDIADYAWAEEAITTLLSKDIVNSVGEGLYGPGKAITRGDFAGFLMRTLGLKQDSAENFADVSEDHPYAKEIAAGKALGILNGVGDNAYMPDAEITRQDLVTICLRGLAKKGYKVTAEGAMQFGDEGEIADYAKDAVAFMAEKEIVIGNESGMFLPKNNTTRAETAVILHRILNTAWEREENAPVEVPEQKEEEKKEEKAPVVFEEETASGEEAQSREEAISVLKALGIYTETDTFGIDDAVTRAMAAKLFYKTMMPDLEGNVNAAGTFADVDVFNDYAPYIAAISDLGIMSGYGDGNFGTEDALTYDAAIASIIKMLGYKAHAEALGGYPAGYLAKATQLGLTEGVKLYGGPIRAGALAKLLANALEINLAEQISFNNGEVFEEGDTALKNWHNVALKKGYVETTYMATMENQLTILRENEVKIDGEVFADKTGMADDFFGYKVTAFVTLDEKPEIVCILPRSTTKTTVIPASDVLMATNTQISYDVEGKDRFVNVAGATLIYNGVPAALDANGNYIPDSGEIVVIENADKTVVSVKAYKNYVLDHANKNEKLLYFKDNTDYPTGLSVDTTERLRHIRFVDETGTETKADGCDEWNIMSVAASADGRFVEIIKSGKSITGTISEISNDSIVLEGTKYVLAKAYRTAAETELDLSKNVVLYLNAFDEVVAGDSSMKNYLYGYIIEGATTKGIDSEPQIKIFTENNEVKVYGFDKTVQIGNGVAATTYNRNDIYTGINPIYNGEKVVKQLVRFTTEGTETPRITSIVTAQDRRADYNAMTMDERENIFTMDASADHQRNWLGLNTTEKSVAAFYGGAMRMWGSQFLSRSKTKIFVIPGEDAADDEYSMMAESALTHVGQGLELTNFEIYDVDKDNVVSAVVWNTTAGSGSSPNYEAANGTVVGRGKMLGEDGDALDVIRVMNMKGDIINVPVDDNTKLYIKSMISASSDPIHSEIEGGLTASILNLAIGDVISYELVNGKASYLNYLFRAQYPDIVEKTFTDTLGSIGSDAGAYKNYGSLTVSYGQVDYVGEYGLRIKTYAKTRTGTLVESYPLYVVSGDSVLLYDSAEEEIKMMDTKEILKGDYVFLKRSTYGGTFVMVVR